MATKIKHRQRRKDLLSEHDEFISFSEKAFKWGTANWPLVIIAAGMMVVAGVVGLLIKSSTAANREQYQVSFQEALKTFQAPVAMEGLPPMPGTVTYTSEKEKYEAAQFKIEKLIREHPDTEASPFIRMYLADSLLKQGKLDEAINEYRQIRQKYPLMTDLEILAKHNEAVALYLKEDYRGALEIFSELAGNDIPLNKASALVYAGNCSKKLGEIQNAIDFYQRAVDGYSDSLLTNGLEAKIKQLKIGAWKPDENPAPPGETPEPPAPGNP